MRTWVTLLGSHTLMEASVSEESTSLAMVQSSRSATMASTASASFGSRSLMAPSVASLTKFNTASSKSMPPRRSMPSGSPSISNEPSVLRSTVASNVPPPRS